MKLIKTRTIKNATIKIPGSKSISHRAIICACLASGRSLIKNILKSDDVFYTIAGLKKMGAEIEETGDNILDIHGFNGQQKPYEKDIYLGNSGTSMRLLTGVAALGNSPYILSGDKRMCSRPMGGLIKALNMAGISAESIHGNNCPPIKIDGRGNKRINSVGSNDGIYGDENSNGGKIILDCSKTSQYLSSVLIIGGLLPEGLDIKLTSLPVSSPYIDITIDIMKKFNVKAEKINNMHYHVSGNQVYKAKDFIVEPDLSNASYFWAAGAITGKTIKVQNISKDSLQGDLRFLDILEQMGCKINYHENGISVTGKDNKIESHGSGYSDDSGRSNNTEQYLNCVDVDMSDIPDVVPTLAVIASFAKGKTIIRNIAHLREKECDRIDAVVSQLKKMGIKAEQGKDWLSIIGGIPSNARIETFNDHRIAMAFSIAGLKVPGIKIENEECVGKSFPSFWEVFDAL